MAYINDNHVFKVKFIGGTGITDQTYNPESANAQSGKAVAEAIANIDVSGGGSADLSNYYTKPEIDNQIGDIETALNNIIAIQNSLIGGSNND